MPREYSEHKKAWLRKYKGVGKEVAKAGVLALSDMAPGISGAARSTSDFAKESASYVSKTSSQMTSIYRTLARNASGRRVSSLVRDVYRSAESGNFSFKDLIGESYESVDDFDSYIDAVESERNQSDDPNEIAAADSKRNTAILGRAVVSGNAANLEALQNVSATIASVSMRSTEASNLHAENMSRMQISNMNAGFAGIGGRLDAINSNLVAIMDFHRSNTALIHQQTMEYNSQSLQMMSEIGEGMSELRDYMKSQKEFLDQQRELTNPKKERRTFNFADGFDMNEYKDFVKRNFQASDAGMTASMGLLFLNFMQMDSMMDDTPLHRKLMSTGLNFLTPDNIKKTISRFDKSFTTSLNEVLYRLGDLDSSDSSIKRFIGQTFGQKRPDIKNPILSDFKKGVMGWNGIAQQTLVEVIPSYLARIESAITKQSAKYYNMDTGKFQTEETLLKNYQNKFNNQVQFDMSDFMNQFKKAFKDDENRDQLADIISNNVYDYLLNPRGSSGTKTRRQMMNELYAMTKRNSSMSSKQVHDLMLAFSAGLSNAQTNAGDIAKEMNVVNRYLWNDETKDTSKYHRRESLLTKRYLTSDGRSLDMLSEAEKIAEMKEKKYKLWKEKINSEWDTISDTDLEQLADDGLFGIKGKIKEFKKKHFKNVSDDGFLVSGANNLADLMLDLALGINKGGELDLPSFRKNTETPNPPSGPSSSSSTGGTTPPTPSTPTPTPVGPLPTSGGGVTTFTLNRKAQNTLVNIIPNRLARIESVLLGFQPAKQRFVVTKSRMAKQVDNATKHIVDANGNLLVLDPTTVRRNAKDTNKLIQGLRNKGNEIVESDAFQALTKHIEDADTSVKATMVSLNDNIIAPMNEKVFGENGILENIASSETMQEIKDAMFDEETGPLGGMTSWMKDQMKEINHGLTGKAYTKSDGTEVQEESNSVFGRIADGYDFIFQNTMKHIFGEDFRDNENYQKFASWADFKNKKANKGDLEALKPQEDKTDAINKTINESLDVKNGKEPAYETIRKASEKAGKIVIERAEAVADYVLGKTDDIESTETHDAQKKYEKNFIDKAKAFLPTGVAAALAGGIIGGSAKLHGTGLLGGLFLPSGIIPGATAAVGLAMLARNEKFQNLMFGEKGEDNKRVGGLISKRTQEAFHKSLPLIVGASTLGALKGAIRGAMGLSTVSGPGGFLMNGLLPGGPIGGALLGLGIGMLKNNESFNRILWGEKGEDGKRTGGALSKGNEKFRKFLEDKMPTIKAGLAGLGTGAALGGVLSGAGVLGSAFSLGGPIGMGLAGLGVGIASQSDKFREYLFGTEEFDKDGNFKGRRGDGLFTRARNALVVNVFDPLKTTIQTNVEDFAFWLKKTFMFPFREAFGPIVDSFNEIKQGVKMTFEDMANKAVNIIETTAKTLLKPITIPFKKFGDVLAKTLKIGAQAALLPASVPLQMLRFVTRKKRRQERGEEVKTLREHAGDIFRGIREETQNQWTNDTRDYGTGIGGWVNRKLTRAGDIIRNTRKGFDTAAEAYEDELKAEGLNALGYLGVRRERRQMKRDMKALAKDRAKWRNIDAERKALADELGNSEALYSNEGLKGIRERFKKAGIDRADELLQTNEDVNRLLYNRSEFMDILNGKKVKDERDEISKKLDSGVNIKVPNDIQKETHDYQTHVISGLDYIVKEFTKLGAESAIRKKDKITMKDLIGIDERLQATGSSWKDLDIDVNRVVDKASISKKDFDKYMEEKFSGGQIRDDENGFLNLVEEILRRTGEIAELTEETKNIQEADILAENGGTLDMLSGIQRGRVDSIARQNAKKKKRDAEKAKESEESEKVRSGHKGDLEHEDENESPGGEIVGLEKDKTIAEKAKGMLTGFFSFLGSTFSSSRFWIGLGILGLMSEHLKDILGKVYDTVKPPVTQFITQTIPSILNMAGKAITEYAPKLVTYLVNNVVDNMGFIIDNMVTIMGAALGTIGKKIMNGISSKLGFGTPFPEAESKTAMQFNSSEDAAQYAEQNNMTAVGNFVLKDNQYVEEDGTISEVSPGRKEFMNSLPKLGYHLLTNASTRKMAATVAKGAAKGSLAFAGAATGGVTGAIMGPIAGWLAKKTVKGSGKLAGKVVGGIFNKLTSNVAETVASDAAKDAAKVAAGEAGKKKVAIGFVKKVGNAIKGAANAVSKYITGKDLAKFADDLTGTVIKWLERADSKLLNKIAEKITKKSGESAAKTALGFTPLTLAFMAYGGVSGLFSAAELFEVDPQDVDMVMRSVSSIMGALFGTGAGSLIEILMEIIDLASGGKVDPKTLIARKIYTAISGEEKMQEAIDRLEAETAKYNKANNANLTTQGFNELTNSNLGLFGRIKKNTWDRLALSSDEWNKKYNFKQYRVSDEELAVYRKNKASAGTVELSEGYGSAVGYGSYLQGDPRWANYPIGKFPNGQVSTMATGGCGPTALSMVANDTSPVGIADYAKRNGYIKDGGATAELFTRGASAFGLQADTLSRGSVKSALAEGKSVIMSGKSSSNGPYTEAGHVIAVNGIGSGERAIVNDPMRGKSIVKTDDLLGGMTHGWSYTRSTGLGNGLGSMNADAIGYGPISNISPSFILPSTTTASSIATSSSITSSSSFIPSLKPTTNTSSSIEPKSFIPSLQETRNRGTIIKKDIPSESTLAGKLKTWYDVDQKIKAGYKQTNEIYAFNTPEFYKGLYVSDIDAMTKWKPELLSDKNIVRFGMMYAYLSSAPFSMNHALTDNEIKSVFGDSPFINSLGGIGVSGQYEYKYGFPFFQTDDPRWAPLPWGGANVSSRGSDLSSLASIVTAYSPNLIDPQYIVENWVTKAPQWIADNGRFNLERVFANDADGFNAMKASQIDGKRLQVSKLENISSMISALKQKKPIVMTGYRYKGGLFGGYYNKNNAPTKGENDYSTIIARAADDDHIAVIDPFSTLHQNTVYSTELLHDEIDGKTIIKSAYQVTDPNGNGIPGRVDLSSKHGTSDYKSIKDAKGLDKITALFSNLLSIGKHVLDSALNNGDYRSIKSIDSIDDDGFDDEALAYNGKENEELVALDGEEINQISSTTHKSSSGEEHGGSGGKLINHISTTHKSSSGEEHGGSGGYFGLGAGFRDLVFGPAGQSLENPSEGSAALVNATRNGDSFTIIQQTGTEHLTSSPNRAIKYLIEHYTTDVSSEKGKARTVAEYFSKPTAGGSADFIVDDEEFVQYNPDPLNMYTHAVGGDKLNSTTSLGGSLHGVATNANSVSIEMVSSKRDKSDNSRATDRDWFFTEAVQDNAAKLTKYLMQKYNIAKENVIMHHHVTGKLCPAMWSNEEADLQGWYDFQKRLNGDFSGTVTNGTASVDSDGTTTITTDGSSLSDTTPTMTNEEMWAKLSFTQKMKAIIAANQASLFGDDYESAKWDSVRSMLGLTTDDSSNSVSMDGSASANQKDTANYISNVLKSNGFSNTAIGGILSNFDAEGGIDATSLEGIYNEPYQIGSKKSSALQDLDAYTKNTLFPYYDTHGPNISKNEYLSNNKYFPGIGLGQWTGPRAEMLINYASQKGKNWYDPVLQTDFMLHGDSSDRISILNSYKQAAESMAPSEAAKWFENKWEGSTHAEARHQATADAWAQFASSSVSSRRRTGSSTTNGSWLDICAKVKAAIAAQKPGYSQSRYITISVDGKQQSVRTDCSGYVSACIRYYTGTNFAENTIGLMRSSNSILESHGFKYMAWPGYEGLQPGDIMVNSSHTEIFAANENGVHKVYNCGSDTSVNTPGTTTDSKSYTCIWRPSNAGNIVLTSDNASQSSDDSSQSSYSRMGNLLKRVAGFGIGSEDSPQEFFEKTLGGFTSSEYGKRNSVFGNEYHRGLDISAPEGQDIISPIDGTIITSGYDAAGYGNYAVVKDAEGNQHIFAHMNRPVGYGDGTVISRGNKIGQVGNTGKTTGSHLHYEIRKNGSKYSTINPSNFRYGNEMTIHSAHSNMRQDNSDSIGSGNRDFSKEIQEKLNVALNTDSIEDKMDSIINVLGTMADGISNLKITQPSNTTTNNTVVYGNGRRRTKTSVSSDDESSKPNADNITTLSQYHLEIAKF